MRRAVIFLILIAICFAIAFSIYHAYSTATFLLERGDMVYTDLTLDSNGNVSGKFGCEHDGRRISSYHYQIIDNELYITLYATAGEVKALETDEDGYVEVRFENLGKIKKIYYLDKEKKHVLTFNED